MKKFDFKLFKEICETRSISGDEKDLVSFLSKQYKDYCDEIIYDNFGCMVAVKKSKKENAKKVLVLAHADEIGFCVKGIESSGVIKVNAIGGISPSILPSNRVVLKNDNNEMFNGVINTNNFNGKISDLVLDFGFDNKEDVINHGIKIGNSIYFVGDTIRLNENRVVSKAIDDRYGCFLTVELLKELKNVDLDVDLYVGVSVQEEVGCRGAFTITNKVKPDFAIVLDCSPSDAENSNGILGKGVLLRVKDANMLAFKSLINYQKKMCKKAKVPCQYFISYGGTDAGSIHKSLDGVLTLTHCICAKNLHSPSTIMDINDYNSAKKSLLYILKDLNEERIEELRKGNR